MSLVLSNKGKGMQSSSEQPLVGEERYVTTRITAAKETTVVQKCTRISISVTKRPTNAASQITINGCISRDLTITLTLTSTILC